jgi:hypothetical protein
MNSLTEPGLTNMILRESYRFVGLREVQPNARWDNPNTPEVETELCQELRELMRPAPWQEGWAYCAAFCEGMVVSALRRLGASDPQIKRFSSVMNAHVLTSFNGFNALKMIESTPQPGAIWFAQHGKTTRGHAGFVTAPLLGAGSMATIEANTSLDASTPAKEREGDFITVRKRRISYNGALVTRGFLPPANILKLIG